MLAVVDREHGLPAPQHRHDQSDGDDHIHDRANDHENGEEADEIGVLGALASERVLHAGAAGKAEPRDDPAAPHHCWSESAGLGGWRLVWVCGGVLLTSSARALTASLRSWPERVRTYAANCHT